MLSLHAWKWAWRLVGGSLSNSKRIENELDALIFASSCTNACGFQKFGSFLWLWRDKIYTPTNKQWGKWCRRDVFVFLHEGTLPSMLNLLLQMDGRGMDRPYRWGFTMEEKKKERKKYMSPWTHVHHDNLESSGRHKRAISSPLGLQCPNPFNLN